MNHLWVCCCESFIPLFLLLFSFFFLNGVSLHPFIQKWLNSALCRSECTTVFSTPAVLQFSVALTPQAIRHKWMPHGLVSNNMVIISHYLRACQLQHWSRIEKKKKDKNNLNQWPLSVEWPLSGWWWRSRPLLQPLKRLLCWLLKKRRGLVSGRPMKVQDEACWQCSHCALFWGLAEGLHWGIVLLQPCLSCVVSPPRSWLPPLDGLLL